MNKDISKTTKTQKQGNAKRRQLRERKRNVAGLETAKKRRAKRNTKQSKVEQEVKAEGEAAAKPEREPKGEPCPPVGRAQNSE